MRSSTAGLSRTSKRRSAPVECLGDAAIEIVSSQLGRIEEAPVAGGGIGPRLRDEEDAQPVGTVALAKLLVPGRAFERIERWVSGGWRRARG
jgi:hypothetical protein